MAWDFAEETVRTLTEGLPDPPLTPVLNLTFPAALHRGERFGAVLFLRLCGKSEWDSDTAVSERDSDGWTWPSSCGGGGWVDPYQRQPVGWDGKPLLICGSSYDESVADDGQLSQATTVEGMAAEIVAAIAVTTKTESFVYDVTSPLGAFVVVVEGDDAPTLVARNDAGDAIGNTVRDAP